MKTIDVPHLGSVKFGRKRPVAVGPHFKLANYLLAALPPPPASADYGAPAQAILSDIMGNDQLGDCVIAAGYHVVGVETSNAGAPYHASLATVVKDYCSIGGYVPGDESTDQGCDEPTAFAFWGQHGFANGTKLSGSVTLNAADKTELMQSGYLFENHFFGMELPDAWVNPFPSGDGFIWDVAGDPVPENGHAVMGYGFNSIGIKIISWGMRGILTWAAVAKYCVQSAGGAVYTLLTPDQIAKGAAKAPNGVAWRDLIVDFDAMGGHVAVPPLPAPTPTPTPTPTPAHALTLAQVQALVVTALSHSPSVLTRTMAINAVNATLAANWPKS